MNLDMKQKCRELRIKVGTQKMKIEQLSDYKDTLFVPYCKQLQKGTENLDDYIDYLYLCLDYYTYTDDVLISDYDYDMVMEQYKRIGGVPIIYADPLNQNKTWNIVKHKEPGVVGSIKKVYEEEDLERWYREHPSDCYILAPKYDGISASVEVKDGEIVRALTRYDGVYGQDITTIVKNAHGANHLVNVYPEYYNAHNGFYKVELCVSTTSFDEMNDERIQMGLPVYANRRSACSGIVNTPTNASMAKYITIIPLAFYDGTRFIYAPPYFITLDYVGSFDFLIKSVRGIIQSCHSTGFEYRTDGCVIVSPDSGWHEYDLLSEAVAFKINTKVGLTRVKSLYVSVGRLGKAVPMANVVPVEVNETIVTDISLGSFDKAVQMGIREGEIVEVFSAGDVIPQLRLQEERHFPKKAEKMHMDLRCPYCGERLKALGREMFCKNPNCERVITGRITNFIQKIGAENISDATIEDLYHAGLIHNIVDIFDLKYDDIRQLRDYGDVSAKKIIDEINHVKDSTIPMDIFIGSLGIDGIGIKTARKILNSGVIKNPTDILALAESKNGIKLRLELNRVDGIGDDTIERFINGIFINLSELVRLVNILKFRMPREWKGSVTFTGFRDSEMEKQINELGYEVTETLTKKSMLLICATADFSSKKCEMARKNRIPIMTRQEVADMLEKGKLKIKKIYKALHDA